MSSQSRLEEEGPKSGSGSRLFDVGALVILITLGAVIPLLIAQSSGALRIPRSDDWSYLTTLFRWIDGNGDIAVATTWERKVKTGVTANEVEQVLRQVATERNMKDVGTLPLSKELEARTGQKQKLLTVYSFCTPTTARRMVDFSPHMAAYLPCRISLVERDDGLWLYTLNMDMMVKMGRKLPSPLKEEANAVRDTIWEMMERGSKGEF